MLNVPVSMSQAGHRKVCIPLLVTVEIGKLNKTFKVLIIYVW